ncbi:MAG: hypothetical protein QM790_08870 [Nibricoccus sp.]
MSSAPESPTPAAAPSAVSGPIVSSASSVLDLEHFKAGSRWRGLYQIGELLPDVTHGKVFKALHVGLMTEVTIRSFKVRNDYRSRVWDSIKQAQNGALLELIEAVEAEGRRFEIVQSPPAVTLREWIGRKKPEQAELLLIIRQLVDSIGALHRHGLVHLNLRPDLIFVRTTDAGLNIVVGGFEMAQLVDGSAEPVEVSVDPFYAPPEAVGLAHHARTPALRAWDWWSLGRVLQEVVLGRHILGHMLERDVSRETPELRARAEHLLKEENHMIRAGAVEMMPAMDRETNTLLRGLLTGARDGRWGLVEVQAWLRKEPVKERYNLPKNERLFIWKDRAYTVAEAAEYFAQAQHWHEGLENIFEPTNAATLAYFLGQEGAHKKTKERFEQTLKLADAPSLQQLPPAFVRDVLAMVILKFLAGSHCPVMLRGRKFEAGYIRELLQPDQQPAGLATVYGLIARPIVQQIEQLDVELGRMLDELGRIFEMACEIALRHRWLVADDAPQLASLVRLSMDAEITLSTERLKMAEKYACSRDPALDRIFKKKDATHAELVVIGFTNHDPKKFHYVTHREWNEEQYRLLSTYGEQLCRAGTWLRLGQALKLGPLIFGRFRFLVPLWLGIALGIAIVWQNSLAYAGAIGFVLAAVLLRFFWHGIHREKVKELVSKERPWRIRSGWWHCRQEALLALQAETIPGAEDVLLLLRQTNEQISKLALDPAPKPVPLPLKFRDTKIVSLVSWLVIGAVVGITGWQAVRHPPKLPDIDWAALTRVFSSAESSEKASAKTDVRQLLEQAPAGGLKSMQSSLEELRRAKREADPTEEKMSWPFKAPTEAQTVRVLQASAAQGEQIAIAREMAELLLDRYKAETVKDLVAVQVPVEKGIGLMLYNGRTGKLVGKKVYVIGFVPAHRAWLDVDSNKALFLSSR